MYLDDALNNFLDTLQPAPDILTNNPSLEQGKFVNDRSRYYAGKKVTVSTDGSIDGSCRTTTMTVQKPDLELIERSSGPEYRTVMEGFNGGSKLQEGLSGSNEKAADSLKIYNAIYKKYNAKNDEYSAALKAFRLSGGYAQSQYFNKFVRVEKTAAKPSISGTPSTPAVPAVYDDYYINASGYAYKIPAGVTTAPPFPAADAINKPTVISTITFAGFRKPTLSADKYEAAPGQNLNLAGTIVRYTTPSTARRPESTNYLWFDIEGVAHLIDDTILSESNTNIHASCSKKIPSETVSHEFEQIKTAIGGKLFTRTPISSPSFVCSELPTNITILRQELAELEKQLNDAGSKMSHFDRSRDNNDDAGDNDKAHWWNSSPQPPSSGASSSGAINLKEYDTLQKNMVTYDGKVGDSTLNVKSKLGYYILWVSLMLFIVVVTFRNIASSESTESGSFMISAALLILLLIYLFDYLSDLRIGPQQMMTKAVGALPEKVSGMMKFTFT